MRARARLLPYRVQSVSAGNHKQGIEIDLNAGHIMAGGIHMDWTQWPVLVVTPPERRVTDAELLEFLDTHCTLFDMLEGPSACVLDLRECAAMPPAQRKMLTERMIEAKEFQEGTTCGAMVFTSRLLRAMLTAIFWMYKPQYPTRVFNDLDDATEWAMQTTLAARGEAGEERRARTA